MPPRKNRPDKYKGANVVPGHIIIDSMIATKATKAVLKILSDRETRQPTFGHYIDGYTKELMRLETLGFVIRHPSPGFWLVTDKFRAWFHKN